MTRKAVLSTVLVLAVFFFASSVPAQDRAPESAAPAPKKAQLKQLKEPKAQGSKETVPQPPKDETVKTEHELTVGGEHIRYTATAGRITVEDANGKKAAIFFTAYELRNTDSTPRPVTFALNGGPGAASVWLHLGALGPRRVVLNSDGTPPPSPARLIDNDCSWLPFTDLVFIDPVGTGYSRSVPEDEKERKQFYAVREDIASLGEFIRLYLTGNRRWLSPKFLIGESYGGTRAAGLSWYLYRTFGISLNGMILVSPALDFATILPGSSNDLPYVLSFPSYAASAWFHHRLSPQWQGKELKEVLAEAERFALNDYVTGLAAGDRLPDEAKKTLDERIAAYCGLTEDFVDRADERISVFQFSKMLLYGQKKITGIMDTTIAAPDPRPDSATASYDPSFEWLYPVFSEAVNGYLRQELKFESDLPYEFLNMKVSREWDWSSSLDQGQGYVDLSESLRNAMMRSRDMKVLIAGGYYDLSVPYFTVPYTIAHLNLDEGLKNNVTLVHYRAGHMIYTHADAREQFTKDAQRFYRSAVRNDHASETAGK